MKIISFVKNLFKKKVLSEEEKRHKHAVFAIHDWTNGVLSSSARPDETYWTDKTRATVFGYVVGSTYEYGYLDSEETRYNVACQVIQQLLEKKLDAAQFKMNVDKYIQAGDKYYQLGFRAAEYDYEAARKRDIVYAFTEAVRFPDKTTFEIEDLSYSRRNRSISKQ